MAQKARPERVVEHVFHPERDARYQHFANAAQHPFDASATSLGRRNTWWLADAALLSYWDRVDALARFAAAGLDATPFSEGGTDAYLARGNGFAIVCFRGTQPDQFSDVFDDVKFRLVDWDGSGTRVHRGFKEALSRVWPTLETTLHDLARTHTIWFTGHSLGASLATLAASRFAGTAGVCTLGSPRVGDDAFAKAFSARFAGRTRRFVADTDLVTHVPPPSPFPYKHVDHLRQIDRHGTITASRPKLPHFFGDLIEDAQSMMQMSTLLQSGVMTAAPKFLLDHMPSGYAIDIWNDYDANGD